MKNPFFSQVACLIVFDRDRPQKEIGTYAGIVSNRVFPLNTSFQLAN
ncbi:MULTISPECIES: hypothetical protein [unclassified Microcoleus]